VAAHFCFVDLFDNDRDLRASVATTFGSIIAELYDCDHSLLSDAVPRFAARPSDLEQILHKAARADPLRRIAVIIDGLDHVDRLPGGSRRNTAAEIVEELAILEIPSGVTFIVVSQPGEHLSAFLSRGSEYAFSRWPDERIREIVQRTELETELRTRALEDEVERVTSSIVDKAARDQLPATRSPQSGSSPPPERSCELSVAVSVGADAIPPEVYSVPARPGRCYLAS
jgi:hypothetical protein